MVAIGILINVILILGGIAVVVGGILHMQKGGSDE
jgi:hypothetical protein